jgi:hypothetical protein
MGYYINQTDSKFFINKSDFKKVVKAIQKLHGKESITDGSGRHFSWVDQDFHTKDSISEILDSWRWEVGFDKDGNIDLITFHGEKLGDDKILFETIAPYVKSGSFIQITGEDDTMWRWIFRDGICFEKYPTVLWD